MPTALLRAACLLLLCGRTAEVCGQVAGLQPPPETIKLMLGTKNKDHKIVLSDQGQCLEVPLVFALVGRESVALEVTLGEQGRFAIEMLHANAPFEIKDVRVEEGVGKAEVVRKAKPMSAEDLRNRRDDKLEQLAGKDAMDRTRNSAKNAKQEEMRRYLVAIGLGDPGDTDKLRPTYVLAKVFEGKAELLRKKLLAAAEDNPRRFTPQDKKTWDAMKGSELFLYYRKVLQTEIAEEHLTACGLDYDRSTRNAAEKIIPMFIALHSLMIGQPPDSDDDKKAMKEAMSGGSAAILRQALTADLRLRIYSGGDDRGDANAQWFNAQRVACRAAGVGSIRVEGSLDPAKGDAADWWIIEKWDPGSIQFTTSSEGGVQFDPPKVEDGVARLRVAAGKKAAHYWFEMTASKGGAMKVVIHESHIPAESKFPY